MLAVVLCGPLQNGRRANALIKSLMGALYQVKSTGTITSPMLDLEVAGRLETLRRGVSRVSCAHSVPATTANPLRDPCAGLENHRSPPREAHPGQSTPHGRLGVVMRTHIIGVACS